MAFAPDLFVAFDTFTSRRLRPGETVYEYLSYLQDLVRLIEENTSDRWLSCALCQDSPVELDDNCVGPKGWNT